MPRKKSTTKQKQKQSQKQNVKQTVIVKVGESARRRRRRATAKKTEEGTSTAYPYMGMTLPPPVIYQTGPAFDAPRLQAFQDFEYPRFSKAGEAAIRRAGPAAPILEDIGSIGGVEIIDVKNKKEQLAELGDLVSEEVKEMRARLKPPQHSAAVKEMMERAKTRPMKAQLIPPVATTASFNEPFGIPPEAAIMDPIPGPAFATPYLPGEFEPMKYKAPFGYYEEEEEEEERAPVARPKRQYIKKTPEQKEAERIKKEERQRRKEQKLQSK